MNKIKDYLLTEVGSEDEELELEDSDVVLELEETLEVQDLEEVLPLLEEIKLSAEVRLIVSGQSIGGDLEEEFSGI